MQRIDVDRLRDDMEDYYGTGAASGIPAMMMEAMESRDLSEDELISKAEEEGFDLSDYTR